MIVPALFTPQNAEPLSWRMFPKSVRAEAEMTTYIDADKQVYEQWGVSETEGGLAVIRPDGVVGMRTTFADVKGVDGFLSKLLVKSS